MKEIEPYKIAILYRVKYPKELTKYGAVHFRKYESFKKEFPGSYYTEGIIPFRTEEELKEKVKQYEIDHPFTYRRKTNENLG